MQLELLLRGSQLVLERGVGLLGRRGSPWGRGKAAGGGSLGWGGGGGGLLAEVAHLGLEVVAHGVVLALRNTGSPRLDIEMVLQLHHHVDESDMLRVGK